MKLFNLILIAFLSANIAFAGGEQGHGGDPFEIYAEEYPDKQKLEAAINLAKEKVHSSGLPLGIEKDILNEMTNLAIAERYLYLESIIIIEQEGKDTYKLPQDAHSFLSLGAMTGSNLGDAIYLSKRTLSYEVPRLSELLIHEVLHHTVTESLSRDEEFIKKAASGIMNNQVSRAMIFALEEGVYLGNKTIAPDQFFDYIAKAIDLSGRCEAHSRVSCSKEIPKFKEAFLKAHPSIMDRSYTSVMDSFVVDAIGRGILRPSPFGRPVPNVENARGHIRIYNLASSAISEAFRRSEMPAELENYFKYRSVLYCKKEIKHFSWSRPMFCGKNNAVLLSDLF